MWKKIKIAFISIGILALVIISFIFGSRTNGSRVSRADDLNRDINDGLDQLQEGLADTQGAIDGVSSDLRQGIKKTDTITKGLGTTQGKLQNALEILRKAKARTATD